jgi:hypothetical protein
MTKNISGQFVENWSEKEKWCLSNLTLGAKLPTDVAEVCDRSKARSGKTKDVFVDISGICYFKNRKDGGDNEFTTRLVSKGGVYSWNEGSKEENIQLLNKAGFVPHENCTPYLAHVKGSKTSKIDMELCSADILDIKLPILHRNTPEKEQKEQWKNIVGQAAKEIRESRQPFEDAIAEKRNQLQLLDNYSSAFSDNKIIRLKDLPFGSYNVMAVREAQTQFGEKYIMLLATDKNGTLGLCYSNKYIETYLHLNLTDEDIEKIRDPKRNYLTLFEKPLAILNVTGWGRTPQRNVIVYCNITLTKDMQKHSIKCLREQVTKEIREQTAKLTKMQAEPTTPSKALPILTREEMVPYKHLKNLAELPLGSTYILVAIGYVEHYGQERLVVKLADGTIYQAGDNLEEQKEQLTAECKIIVSKTKLSSTRRKFAVCKVVQRGDWAGALDYEKVPLLPASKKRKAIKVLDVKPIEHKGQKRKLVLAADGNVYKVKRSKLENTVKGGQYV